jgi:hypothetical protein
MISRGSLFLLAAGCTVSVFLACGSDDGKRTARGEAGAGGQAGAPEPGAGGAPPTPSAGAGGEVAAPSSGAGGDGGAAGAPGDNCPDLDDPDQSDLDQDGLGDVCDDDIDGDGFPNADDPDPADALLPGDFSTVEAILADPLVAAALTDLDDLGADLAITTETTPPNLTGFYRKPDGQGTFTATSSATDIGRPVVGLEHYDVLHPGGLFDSMVVAFLGNAVQLTSTGVGNFVRGSGQHFSTFSRDANACTAGGSNYRTWSIRIITGDQDALSGDVINLQVLSVTVAVDGVLTPACESLLAGESELLGGWSLWEVALDSSIAPSALTFLCQDVDELVHLPGTAFMDSSGAACTCDAGIVTCE